VKRWSRDDDRYVVVGTSDTSLIKCRACGESTSFVSNAAVAEERDRLLKLMAPRSRGACRSEDCPHYGHDVGQHPQHYQAFGRTSVGSQRYRCRGCKKTFSSSTDVNHRLRRRDKTVEILRYLVNRVAMRRLCEIADISADTLYQRIGLIYERCRAFAAHHERALLEGKALEHVHVAIDRQQHVLNWGSSFDRRPSVLLATVSAEGRSGYILAQHINFDPDADAFAIDLAAREAGDPGRPPAFRRFARLWLPHERLEPDAGAQEPNPSTGSEDVRPASRGTMVHDNAALLAHFQVLRCLLGGAKSIQLSMDREAGIERAALVTFADRVRDGSLDAFLVRIVKEISDGKKRKGIADAELLLAQARSVQPHADEFELIRGMIRERYMRACADQKDHRHRWVVHPYPTMSEPERAAVCLTADAQRSIDHLVYGFARASLRSVDRYFMQVRRMVHLLERPTQSASSGYRTYYAYSPYSAVVVMRLLEIFRVVYNYHAVGRQTTTPAMRIGLATKVFSLEDVLRGPGQSEVDASA
jgi:transposase-like protein